MKRPYPERISQWNNMDEIIYQCPTCGTSFNFYGDNEFYCHNCGEEILWRGMPLHCSEEIKNKYHTSLNYKEQEKIMEELRDSINKSIVKGVSRE